MGRQAARRSSAPFPISYRDLAAMLSDRGVVVDHTTLFRWVQAYAAKLEQRIRRHLRPCTASSHDLGAEYLEPVP